ncbi:hypothetical protein [Sporotomaculum syntrophicum]|uniref:hypothetical protein n=1 Tax=Sporotomaculum syntrophicum TaxID=182264 RepID=UPI00137B3639|nr:hypothetical protein [Sporotomaculum syntrophicum]
MAGLLTCCHFKKLASTSTAYAAGCHGRQAFPTSVRDVLRMGRLVVEWGESLLHRYSSEDLDNVQVFTAATENSYMTERQIGRLSGGGSF